MTYGELKSLTSGLLIGDTLLPLDSEVLKGLVQYALNTVATQADSLHLRTLNKDANILRLAQGDYFIRTPQIPNKDTDFIDIDEELTFAVARYLASYISKEKSIFHMREADRVIKDYNSKVYEVTNEIAVKDNNTGVIYAF